MQDNIVKSNNYVVKIKSTLPVVQQAIAVGLNEREMGIVLGFLGDDPQKQYSKITKDCTSDKEAISLVLTLANANLVAQLYKLAVGTTEIETVFDQFNTPKYDKEGNVIIISNETKKRNREVIKPPDVSAVKLLVHNQLPELFSNTQEVRVDKRSVEIQASKPAELTDFAQALSDLDRMRKKVESAVLLNNVEEVIDEN